MDIFEKASRLKLRFTTVRGICSVEDLWDLPLTSAAGRPNLDDIARGLNKLLKSEDDVSFVTPEKKSDGINQLAFDVVKYVIDFKIVESKARLEASEKADKKRKILEILADKQDESLRGKSEEDLKKLLETI